ncbi:MAG: AAA family ATPase [Promethearchaeota archaeon]
MENQNDLTRIIRKIQEDNRIIGRSSELRKILIAYFSGKNVLLEGEIGTSKTTLARAVAAYLDKDFYRIDGSEDVLSHVLVGYFDPPKVIAEGYNEKAFIYGPLSLALRNGGVLFINELNRLPESTQNVLLSALDEKFLDIPKLKAINGKDSDFFVITTINPAAHVGVSNLGEALKDRFVWIKLDYQSRDEEIEIVKQNLEDLIDRLKLKLKEGSQQNHNDNVNVDNVDTNFSSIIAKISEISVEITRRTRLHEDLRRGSSIRGAIDLASLMFSFFVKTSGLFMNDNAESGKIRSKESKILGLIKTTDFWFDASEMALSSKVELEDGAETTIPAVIKSIVEAVLKDFQ